MGINNLVERIWHCINRQSSDGDDGSMKLSEISDEFKNFIDEIPGGFLVYRADESEEIVYANRALIRIFGCNNMQEFLKYTGNSFKGIVHPEDLGEVEASIRYQIEHSADQIDSVEYRIIDVNGNVHRIDDYGRLIRSEVLGDIFYVFLTDVTEKTERLRNERDMLINLSREKEERLKKIIKKFGDERRTINQEHLRRLEVIEGLSVNYDSILYVDLDNDRVLPYRLSIRTAKQFEDKLCPKQYSAFIEDYVASWVYSEDYTLVTSITRPEYIKEKLAESKTYYTNYRCVVNGKISFLQLRIVNVGGSDDVTQIVMGFRNVDEELQREMQHMQLLERALKNAKQAEIARNVFLSNMSHDMRTPLNAIFGYTSIAKSCINNPSEVGVYLQKIEGACKDILGLVENVLEMSERQSTDNILNETECNICDLVDEVQYAFLNQTEQKRIKFVKNTVKVEHSEVYADCEKLKQVLMKLVANAVKYTGLGGKVELNVFEKEVISNGYSQYIFEIRDTGVGIDKQFIDRLFEPFEREKNTTFSGIYGMGLGLTIAKNTLDMMDGEISVESEAGNGSVFTVSVKLRRQGHPLNSTIDTIAIMKELQSSKILLVDDNDINLEIEAEMLEGVGFTVETARNGKIAVDKIRGAKRGEYAVVLMDIQMPVMDGRQATEEIRKLEDKALSRIPVIALSANAFESDRRISMERGMNAHLTKPIDMPVLIETMAKCVSALKHG